MAEESSIPTDGLVAYWSFDGDMLDHYGSNDGSCVDPTCPTLTVGVGGVADMAYSFDGINDYIEIEDSADLRFGNSMTISAWILPTEKSQDVIISKRGSQNANFIFTLDTTNDLLKFWTYRGGYVFIVSNSTYKVGEFQHVAITIDGDNNVARFYFNGNADDELSYPYTLYGSNTDEIYIGIQDSGSGPNNSPFEGAIDEVRIYNRALISTEIQAIYDEEKP